MTSAGAWLFLVALAIWMFSVEWRLNANAAESERRLDELEAYSRDKLRPEP